MKKYSVLLAVLLVLSALLTACGSESSDNAEDYVRALLAGNAEKAQKYACASYQDATAAMAAALPGLEQGRAVKNVDLKVDLGKGNNKEEVLITGAYEIVSLNEAGKEIVDSEDQYELAASVRDRYDMDEDGDDTDKINTRIVLTMKEEGDDWCVAMLDGGYYHPEIAEGTEE